MRIFLGGTCDKEYKWRKELIPLLSVDYFNPEVDDWTEEDRLNEEKEKGICDILLYVITKRDSIYSVVEATDNSNKTPDKTVLCFYDEHKSFTDKDKKSFDAIAIKIKENGSKVFYSLTEVSKYIDELQSKEMIKKNLSTMGFPVSADNEVGRKELDNRINNLIQLLPNAKQISDGYHTFYDLYDHRCALFAVVCSLLPHMAFKSKNHHVGGDDMFDDMFIVGLETPHGQITYHYHLDKWDWFNNTKELPNAPKWDGHTPEECVKRLVKLSKLK